MSRMGKNRKTDIYNSRSVIKNRKANIHDSRPIIKSRKPIHTKTENQCTQQQIKYQNKEAKKIFKEILDIK